MKKIEVLDHGFVRLVDHMGSDLSIARNARVSYDAEWRAGEDKKSDARLIRYLMNNGHNTPFESVTFTFDVKAPIFVIRQWHRHRTQSYNEISARYKQLPAEFYIPKLEVVGVQSKGNKQMRDMVSSDNPDHKKNIEDMLELMNDQNNLAFYLYNSLLEDGMPRELARSILPLGTYTHMFATMNLHNLLKFLGERLHEHAQWEIQQYAKAILELIEPVVPVAVSAFKESLA